MAEVGSERLRALGLVTSSLVYKRVLASTLGSPVPVRAKVGRLENLSLAHSESASLPLSSRDAGSSHYLIKGLK